MAGATWCLTMEDALRNYTGNSKIGFPRFNGFQVHEWLPNCEQFFYLYNTPPESKVKLAAMNFEGLALQWHLNYMRLQYDIYPSWHEYVVAVVQRFGNANEEPRYFSAQKNQTRCVHDYRVEFGMASNHTFAEFSQLHFQKPSDLVPNQHSTLDLQIDFQKQGDAPDEDLSEAAANTAEEDFSDHHQSPFDDLVANPASEIANEQKSMDPTPFFFDSPLAGEDGTEKSQVEDNHVADPLSEGNKFTAVADSVSVIVDEPKVPPPNSVSFRSETSLPCFEIASSVQFSAFPSLLTPFINCWSPSVPSVERDGSSRNWLLRPPSNMKKHSPPPEPPDRVAVPAPPLNPSLSVTTTKDFSDEVEAAADFSGSVLTGVNGNSLGVLARQLGLPLHKVRDVCPLYLPDGKCVDSEIDSWVEVSFNKLLERVCKVRHAMIEEIKSVDSLLMLQRLTQVCDHYTLLHLNDPKIVEEDLVVRWISRKMWINLYNCLETTLSKCCVCYNPYLESEQVPFDWKILVGGINNRRCEIALFWMGIMHFHLGHPKSILELLLLLFVILSGPLWRAKSTESLPRDYASTAIVVPLFHLASLGGLSRELVLVVDIFGTTHWSIIISDANIVAVSELIFFISRPTVSVCLSTGQPFIFTIELWQVNGSHCCPVALIPTAVELQFLLTNEVKENAAIFPLYLSWDHRFPLHLVIVVGTGARLVEVKEIGGDCFVFIVGCKEPSACAIFLKGVSNDLLNEIERNIQNAMSVWATDAQGFITSYAENYDVFVARKLQECLLRSIYGDGFNPSAIQQKGDELFQLQGASRNYTVAQGYLTPIVGVYHPFDAKGFQVYLLRSKSVFGFEKFSATEQEGNVLFHLQGALMITSTAKPLNIEIPKVFLVFKMKLCTENSLAIAALHRKMIDRGSVLAPKILVKWKDLPPKHGTWEFYHDHLKTFIPFHP